MALRRKNPWPKGKAYDLLQSYLRGKTHTIGSAFFELNCGVLSARSAELRKKGWPVNSHTMPHPSFPNESCKQYSFDAHFLNWWGDGRGKHPFDYPHHDGRGKFIEEDLTDDLQDKTKGSDNNSHAGTKAADPQALAAVRKRSRKPLTGIEAFLADAEAI